MRLMSTTPRMATYTVMVEYQIKTASVRMPQNGWLENIEERFMADFFQAGLAWGLSSEPNTIATSTAA